MTSLINKFYDISKFVIWGDDNLENTDKKPKMVFSFRDGNPRITVYTGIPSKEGVISFPSDYSTMVTVLNLIKDIAKGEPGNKVSIDSLATVYENDKPTTEKKVVSTLYIGKSKEGLVYLSVMTENKPKIVFTIKPSPYHIFRDKDKNFIPDDIVSEKMATGLADFLLNIISNIIVNYTNEEYKTVRKPTAIKSNNSNQSFTELDDLNI